MKSFFNSAAILVVVSLAVGAEARGQRLDGLENQAEAVRQHMAHFERTYKQPKSLKEAMNYLYFDEAPLPQFDYKRLQKLGKPPTLAAASAPAPPADVRVEAAKPKAAEPKAAEPKAAEPKKEADDWEVDLHFDEVPAPKVEKQAAAEEAESVDLGLHESGAKKNSTMQVSDLANQTVAVSDDDSEELATDLDGAPASIQSNLTSDLNLTSGWCIGDAEGRIDCGETEVNDVGETYQCDISADNTSGIITEKAATKPEDCAAQRTVEPSAAKAHAATDAASSA